MCSLSAELELEKEKSIAYRGTARVALKWLIFQHGKLNLKHVQNLQKRFQKDCRRLESHNHIPALVEQRHLDCALHISGLSKEDLPTSSENGLPLLNFWTGYQLQCLHGQHRIQAAKETLLPSDQWWTVDLYLTGKWANPKMNGKT